MAKDILTVLIDNAITFILLFGAVWGIRLIFQKKLSAVIQYALWGVVILRLLLPIGIPTPASPWNLIGSAPAIVQAMPDEKPISPADPDNELTVSLPQDGGYVPVNYTGNNGQTQPNTVHNVTPEQTTTVNTVPAPVKIDWMAIALYALLAGAIAKGAWQYGRYMKLKRRVKLCGENASTLHYDILEHCKRESDIQKDVKVTLLEGFSSPAIMGWRKPVLIMPASMASSIDIEKLSHIFYHELIHIKRRDTVTILLLNVLGAIYWWNPLVWLCFRQVRRDMETLCDCTVVKTLGEQGRKRYIETLIAMAGGGSAPHVLAGVSMNDGKMNMQRRIKGMYKQKKTGKPIIATIIILAAAFAFATFTTACAPAALAPIISAIASPTETNTPSPSAPVSETPKYDKPDTWTETLDIPGSMQVTFNAQIVMPTEDKYPEVEFTREPFSQDQIGRLMKYFVGDKKMIAKTSSGKAKKGYITAADIKTPGDKDFDAYVELGNGSYGNVWIHSNSFRMISGSDVRHEYAPHFIIGELKITRDDAISKAEKVLSDLNINYLTLACSQKAELYPQTKTAFEAGANRKPISNGYLLTFSRKIGNFDPVCIQSLIVLRDETKESYLGVNEETIEIYIDEAGQIQMFGWRGHSKMVANNENTTLLPFDKIQQIAKDEFKKLYPSLKAGKEYGDLTYVSPLKVDRVEMRMAPFRKGLMAANTIMAPVWYVRYHLTSAWPSSKEGKSGSSTVYRALTISALDGNVITTVPILIWNTASGDVERMERLENVVTGN